ncbi:MAG: DUF1018 domain-containing protein [Bacteroidetes bacterium]|nr:DUF1018 domain-containing protein [Bacteroidota bacterium]
MGKREKLIQLIHVARSHTKECLVCGSLIQDSSEVCGCGADDFQPMTDGRYRSSLKQLTGFDSCSKLTELQLEKVLDLFKQVGFIPRITKEDPEKSLQNTLRQQVYLVQQKAQEILGENWEGRLDGFLRNMSRSSLKFCNHNELRKVHGWLSRTKKKGA